MPPQQTITRLSEKTAKSDKLSGQRLPIGEALSAQRGRRLYLNHLQSGTSELLRGPKTVFRVLCFIPK